MNINFNGILHSLLTAGILSLCAIAWKTYNEFITVATKIEFVAEKLEHVYLDEREIFMRLNDIEKKIAKLEVEK